MSAATEFEIKVSNEVNRCKEFVRIPASELNLEEDWFGKFNPETYRTKKFYKEVKVIIQRGVEDFYRPTMDPSFNEDGTEICYVPGKKPAIGKLYKWWAKTAREFNPECKSRLGTKSEYIAFLAVLIKKLVTSGWKVKDAWEAVCDDSKELGHYWTSKNATHEFEVTGSREICGFYDLANTYKILTEDEENGDMWRAGGYYIDNSDSCPLAEMFLLHYCNFEFDSTGWIVFESNPNQHE